MKQYFTHITGCNSTWHDVQLKHPGIMKVSTIKRMAQEAGIVHELKANVEIVKKGVKQITPVDLINVSKKEM